MDDAIHIGLSLSLPHFTHIRNTLSLRRTHRSVGYGYVLTGSRDTSTKIEKDVRILLGPCVDHGCTNPGCQIAQDT